VDGPHGGDDTRQRTRSTSFPAVPERAGAGDVDIADGLAELDARGVDQRTFQAPVQAWIPVRCGILDGWEG
jgi:hypothetical protein